MEFEKTLVGQEWIERSDLRESYALWTFLHEIAGVPNDKSEFSDADRSKVQKCTYNTEKGEQRTVYVRVDWWNNCCGLFTDITIGEEVRHHFDGIEIVPTLDIQIWWDLHNPGDQSRYFYPDWSVTDIWVGTLNGKSVEPLDASDDDDDEAPEGQLSEDRMKRRNMAVALANEWLWPMVRAWMREKDKEAEKRNGA